MLERCNCLPCPFGVTVIEGQGKASGLGRVPRFSRKLFLCLVAHADMVHVSVVDVSRGLGERPLEPLYLVEKIYPPVIKVVAGAYDLQPPGALTLGQKLREA